MKKYLLALAAAALGCCTISTASEASVITATWEGTVDSFVDATGIFGTPGGDLAGDSYKVVFTMDTQQGDYLKNPHGDAQFDGISAVMTINGHDYSVTGDQKNGSYDIAERGETHIMSSGTYTDIVNELSSLSKTTTISMSLGGSGDISGFPDSIYTSFATSTCPPGGTCGGTVFFASTHADLNFGSYSVSATPIPATLPLFISALGGLGFVGWRHRKLAA
jgi:hypothetical protein